MIATDNVISTPLNRLAIATTGRMNLIEVDHLVRIEAWSNYSKLVFANGRTLVVAKVLKKFQEQLRENHFIRAHNTHLVNIHFIRSISSNRHPSLHLENGERVSVSRRKYPEVLKQLNALEIKMIKREAS